MRRVDALGIVGLLMLAGAAGFFLTRGMLPLWVAWIVGPLLWYLGFAVIAAWLGFRIFGGSTQAEERDADTARQTASKAKVETATLQPVVVINVRSNFHEHDWDFPLKEGQVGKATLTNIFGKIPMASLAIVALILSAAPLLRAVDVPDAAATFKSKCAMCHGADAAGKTAMGAKLNIRDLRSDEVQKQSDAALVQAITKGKNKMPAYEGKLTAEDIKNLKIYIRELPQKH